MIFISSIVASVLRSLEFFRSGVGRWFTLILDHFSAFKFFSLPLLVWGVIRFVISLFTSFCSTIRGYLDSLNFQGIQVGGVDILALANSVLPVDETIGLIVSWFSVAALVAVIRFVRAAWQAIPLKST